MAGAGMALRRGTAHTNTESGDDVQRSIELLDRVLSEFDDVENANQVQNIQQQITSSTSTPQLRQVIVGTVSTPDDESPSLGHQSEDDGYMSMNGRKPKFNLAFKPLAELVAPVKEANDKIPRPPGDPDDFPPPPEEAQRLIATLLPKVSPINHNRPALKSPNHHHHNNSPRNRQQFPLTHLPLQRIDTIPPPQRFQNVGDSSAPVGNGLPDPIHTATQTTLPKTRHQRPYGWEQNDFALNPPPPSPPGYRFGSLPFQHGIYSITSPTRVPPRTVPTALGRHREVKRRASTDEDNVSDLGAKQADDEHFSDDSLEEMLLPPPPPPPPPLIINKRASIAWEVPLDNDEGASLTPGSTKVVGGRRRRKSGSGCSSTSSIPNRLKDVEDWPDPPPCTTEDEITSPFSDSDESTLPAHLNPDALSKTGTYIIRRNGKKERKAIISPKLTTPQSRHSIDLPLPHAHTSPKSRFSLDLTNSRLLDNNHDFNAKQHSTTFDNFQSLLHEGVCYPNDKFETTVELAAPLLQMVRVVSVGNELDVTVEEDEENSMSPLRQIEQNISELLERRDIQVVVEESDEKCILNGVEALKQHTKEKRKGAKSSRTNELQKSSSHNEIQRSEDYYRQLLIDGGGAQQFGGGGGGSGVKRNAIQKSESAKEMLIAHRGEMVRHHQGISGSTSADFPVRVEVLDFPPLPPSPVEEDDEYSEILPLQAKKSRADTLPNAPPPTVPPHRIADPNSLKTRSMDANYTHRNSNRTHMYSTTTTSSSSSQQANRRPFQKRSSPPEPHSHHLQTSCSLPETPIFSRGCDIVVPRTPHRRAPDIPAGGGAQTAPRHSTSMNTISTATGTAGFRRGVSNLGLEQAIVGAELLRLAGGPGRGWYPKQRHRRPASIEHLDRMAMGGSGGATAAAAWADARKPLTLPPNLTPKFFQRSPRDALRRVTSLLIRKGNGNGNKESKKDKEVVSPTTIHENAGGEAEVIQKKKGFFKSFWKRSRHYSLEQQ